MTAFSVLSSSVLSSRSRRKFWKPSRGDEKSELSLLSKDEFRSDEVVVGNYYIQGQKAKDETEVESSVTITPDFSQIDIPTSGLVEHSKKNVESDIDSLAEILDANFDSMLDDDIGIDTAEDDKIEGLQHDVPTKDNQAKIVTENAASKDITKQKSDKSIDDKPKTDVEQSKEATKSRKQKKSKNKAKIQKQMISLSRSLSQQLSIKSTKSNRSLKSILSNKSNKSIKSGKSDKQSKVERNSNSMASTQSTANELDSILGSITDNTKKDNKKDAKKHGGKQDEKHDEIQDDKHDEKHDKKAERKNGKRKWRWSALKVSSQAQPKAELGNEDDDTVEVSEDGSRKSTRSFDFLEEGTTGSDSSADWSTFRAQRQMRHAQKKRRADTDVANVEVTFMDDLLEAVSDAFPSNWIQCGCPNATEIEENNVPKLSEEKKKK